MLASKVSNGAYKEEMRTQQTGGRIEVSAAALEPRKENELLNETWAHRALFGRAE